MRATPSAGQLGCALLLVCAAATIVHAFLPTRAPQLSVSLQRQLLARTATVSPAGLQSSLIGQQQRPQGAARMGMRLRAAEEGQEEVGGSIMTQEVEHTGTCLLDCGIN